MPRSEYTGTASEQRRPRRRTGRPVKNQITNIGFSIGTRYNLGDDKPKSSRSSRKNYSISRHPFRFVLNAVVAVLADHIISLDEDGEIA